MTLRARIVVLAFAAIFAAGPAFALAGDCVGCCCLQQAPCPEAQAGCPSLERAMGCCDTDAAVAPAPALRSFDPPALDPWQPPGFVSPADALRMPAPACPGRLESRISPLRLSVIQRN